MTKLQNCHPRSASSKLGIGKDSHVISKFKPKIRIIHIYAPEIIKTDAANFRELVQRLTGKPEDEGRGRRSKSKATPAKDPAVVDLHPNKAMMTLEEEDHEQEFLNLQNGTGLIKNEHEGEEVDQDYHIWRGSKSNEKLSVFLDEFSELEGFMEELSTVPQVDQN